MGSLGIGAKLFRLAGPPVGKAVRFARETRQQVMTDVAIVGASGYGARELFRILLSHRGAQVVAATSTQEGSPRVDALHPSLAGRVDLACEPFDAESLAERVQVAFLALP